MKKLLSILGSVGMIATTGVTVVSCGNGEKKLDSRDTLKATIEEAEANLTSIQEKNKDEWGGVTQSGSKAFAKAIVMAKEVLRNTDTTEEELNETTEALEATYDAFVAALPANIIAEVINQQEDITDIVDKSWTYSSFFNMNGEKNEDHQSRVLDLFYGGISKSATTSHGYIEDEADKLHELVMSWSKDNINLVYINVGENGQKVEKPILSTNPQEDTVEELFLSAVAEEFKEEDLTKPEFWENHPKLSLGISFAKDVEGSKLPSHAKDFWTFTFKTN